MNSYSHLLTRCQESKCKLTCGWENINHAIQPGCIRWVEPLAKSNTFPVNVSPSKVEDEVDDTPPLTDDSDSDSDSSEDEATNIKISTSMRQKTKTKNLKPPLKSKTSRKGPFSCPVLNCPISNVKSWSTAPSLHKHIQEHCIGRFSGVVPEEYFKTWNKQFCSNCSHIRMSFDPSPYCSCCQRSEPKTKPKKEKKQNELSASLNYVVPQLQDPPSSPNDLNTDFCLPAFDEIIKIKSPTLKHVPKRLRSEWSRAWTETIQDCLFLNDTTSYVSLFLLSKICLQLPPSNLKSRKMKEEFTHNLIKRWRGTSPHTLNSSKFKDREILWLEYKERESLRPPQKLSKEDLLKRRIVQMVADGRLSAASAALISESIAKPTEENLQKLLEKHPLKQLLKIFLFQMTPNQFGSLSMLFTRICVPFLKDLLLAQQGQERLTF